jgi:hypothetical protein
LWTALFGVFTCAACDYESEMYAGSAFLFNGTMRSQSLRLYRLQPSLDCTRAVVDPPDWPGRDAFALSACPTLASRDILLLDRGGKDLGWDFGTAAGWFHIEPVDAGIADPVCDAVLLQAEGLVAVVVTWNGVDPIVFSGGQAFADLANSDHGLILERAGERLFIAGTSLLQVLSAGFDPAPADCPNGER